MVQVTATLVKEPPSGDEWLHELKFDGYRTLCRIDRRRVSVWSRNGKDWTEKFQNVVEAVKSLRATSATLDGEIVIVDAQGRSSFQKLQRAMGKSRVAQTPPKDRLTCAFSLDKAGDQNYHSAFTDFRTRSQFA